jgi:hypothetical protein
MFQVRRSDPRESYMMKSSVEAVPVDFWNLLRLKGFVRTTVFLAEGGGNKSSVLTCCNNFQHASQRSEN